MLKGQARRAFDAALCLSQAVTRPAGDVVPGGFVVFDQRRGSAAGALLASPRHGGRFVGSMFNDWMGTLFGDSTMAEID